jgi:CRP-like cAMP-binding protein
MLAALEKSLGVVTTACRAVGMSRDTHYRWLKEDPEYAHQVAGLAEIALDFGESQLHKLMQDGNPASVIFFLKTKGKGRGYVESNELRVYTPDTAPSWLDGSPIGDEATEDIL